MENEIKKRNYGIDIFKIFSMFMVVAVHMMDGVVLGCQPGTLNEYVSKFIQTFFFFAVNCFALSSGFIQINVKYKFNRIVRMWLQVFFYSVCITIFFLFLLLIYVVREPYCKVLFLFFQQDTGIFLRMLFCFSLCLM